MEQTNKGPPLCAQVWFWNPHTIMIYEVAPYNTSFPANNLAEMARTEGMDAMVEKCIQQIRDATGLADLKDPDWARLKTWPHASILAGWKSGVNQDTTDGFVDKMSRPLGPGVPLFYGNSEVAKDGNNHGWVEGALELVEQNMPELVRQLGLDDYEEYDPRDFMHLDKLQPDSKKAEVEVSAYGYSEV